MHAAQRAPDQRPEHPVAAQRARGQARIEDVRRDAAVAAAEQQVRPQLGFHDQRQGRPEMLEETRDRAGQVVRQVDMHHRIPPQRLHALGTGGGDGGDHQPQAGVVAQQARHQRRGGIDLAHRYRMQPQRRLHRDGRITGIAFVPALEIGALAEPAPDQVVEGDRRKDVQGGGVQAAQHALGEVGPHRYSITKRARPIAARG